MQLNSKETKTKILGELGIYSNLDLQWQAAQLLPASYKFVTLATI